MISGLKQKLDTVVMKEGAWPRFRNSPPLTHTHTNTDEWKSEDKNFPPAEVGSSPSAAVETEKHGGEVGEKRKIILASSQLCHNICITAYSNILLIALQYVQ